MTVFFPGIPPTLDKILEKDIKPLMARGARTVRLIAGALLVVSCLSACSSMGTADQASARKIPLHEQEMTKVENPSAHATVVVYRQGPAGSEKIGNPAYPPVNLYINGDYHASLRPMSQVEMTLCAGSQRLYPLLDSTATALSPKNDKGAVYDLKSGTKQYFRVMSGSDGVAMLEAVKTEDAQRELASPSRQVYTISRFHVQQVCGQ